MTRQPTLPFDRPMALEPPPDHARLRSRSPVARVATPDGGGVWLVTSFAAASAVLTDSRFGVTPPGAGGADSKTLLQDGEGHARLRRLVGRAFTPRRVAAMRPAIEVAATSAVERMLDAGPPADLVDALAAPLSIAVISDLLGVPADEVDRFRSLADTVSAADPFAFDVSDDEIVALVEAWQQLTDRATELVVAKRAGETGPDLLSDLIAVRDDDDGRLDDEELVSLAATIVAAGYRTATSAIAIATIRLIEDDALAPLADDPARRAAAVEEVLRIHAGQVGEPFPRHAQTDVELAGAQIAAGDIVLVRLEAAHRDPDRFADPDRFDASRETSHIAFGRGPHHCLGAALARTELDAALSALGRLAPQLRLDGRVDDIEWVRGIDAAPASVHVTW